MPRPPPVRFKPMSGKVACVAILGQAWVQHEYSYEEAVTLAGELARAILDVEAWRGDATWDLKRK